MDEDEAALLAELRAISNRSSAAGRFNEDNAETTPSKMNSSEDADLSFVSAKSSFALTPPHEKEKAPAPLSPQQRTPSKQNDSEETAFEEKVMIAAPTSPEPIEEAEPEQTQVDANEPTWKASSLTSTFKGDRGGVAEDAELLAELRAISAKSSGADRFADAVDGDNTGEKGGVSASVEESVPDEKVLSSPRAAKSRPASSEVPPWKRDKKKDAMALKPDVEVVVAASPVPAPKEPIEEAEPVHVKVDESALLGPGNASSLTSTFKGDRGGVAEDAELLAELRAISAKSSGADRFADAVDGDNTGEKGAVSASVEESVPDEKVLSSPRAAKSRPASSEVPPWKRDKKKDAMALKPDVEVVVAASPVPAPKEPIEEAEPVHVKVDESALLGPGIASSLTSTFKGDRGGVAEDAELLAELRAISAKSSGADRFAEDAIVGDDTVSLSVKESVSGDTAFLPARAVKSSPASSEVPPWKRDKTMNSVASNIVVEVVVAAPPAPAQVPVEESEPAQVTTDENVPVASGFNSSSTTTFKGDRGGVAEDAELLAELRAISAKSYSVDRFADDSNGGEHLASSSPKESAVAEAVSQPVSSSPRPSKPSSASSEVPPWKRGKKKAAEASVPDVGVVVAAPPVPPREPIEGLEPVQTEAGESSPQANRTALSSSSTFQGDRGGPAEDPELLAELMAISAKSSSADRFTDDDGAHAEEADSLSTKGAMAKAVPVRPRSPPRESKPGSASSVVPPWKRGKKKPAVASMNDDADAVVAAPPEPAAHLEPALEPTSKTQDSAPLGVGIRSSLPSTFQGDRGGAANDAELLAELRAISASSTSADRFSQEKIGGVEVSLPSVKDDAEESAPPLRQPSRASKSMVVSSEEPPWKRGKKKAAVASMPEADAIVAAPKPDSERAQPQAGNAIPENIGIKSSLPSTFKGDRGGPAEDAELLAELRAVSSQSRGGIQSNLPSTFKGERGGSAEDADLLAELRAVSTNSSSRNRFSSEANAEMSESNDDNAGANSNALRPPSGVHSAASQPSSNVNGNEPPVFPATGAGNEWPEMSEASLPSALLDKNWKKRKQAYVLLRNLLASQVKGGAATGHINADTLMPGLDVAVPAMVADSNAAALDTALEFANDFAEHCRSASSSELAAKIVASLVKGSAFSSSKPSTGKQASNLTLKLMEVGDEGYASVHAVTDILLSQGLTSRKPKVVVATLGLILQAAHDFGAGSLPLASISSAIPKMMSHSNPKVRETGLGIVAEICRALGSKTPLQEVIDNMKSAQLAQLDGLLESQPDPTPIGVGLRSSSGSSSQSPADALAALEEGSKKLEAKRFAERPPVNILQELPKTEYSTRIKEQKWSEKVAALEMLLECGGEKPYKLVQPSSSVNYSPLISETKKLLSHSHFAVASKSMQVISMLAEGVGANLFPHLRPLLSQLLYLSKDKKLNRAVTECLDSLFGNVLEINHLIDEDDALPSVLNEKTQKNALVRTTALQFLGRCIERRESAGPRGTITCESARGVAHLCCAKLEDSDAAVRKAATDSLRLLLVIEDGSIAEVVGPIVESLESKNPRTYKSLKGSITTTKKTTVSVNTRSTPADLVAPRETRTLTRPKAPVSRPPQKASPPKQKESSHASRATPVSGTSDSSMISNACSVALAQEPSDAPSLDTALSQISAIHIPLWDSPEDDGGILASLKASKWLYRQSAISSLATFSKTEDFSSQSGLSSALLVIVKANTKGFKDTNVNVTKAIMELIIALTEVHADRQEAFPGWACRDCVYLGVEKIFDKKLSTLASSLLSSMCVVCAPQTVLDHGITCIDKIKSPLGHESFLQWFKEYLNDFGAASIGAGIKSVASWVLKECESSNPKVRKMALSVMGELHMQVGPVFRALALSSCLETSSVRAQLERTLDENPFDPNAAKEERARECVVLQLNNNTGSKGSSAVLLELPKSDLVASLSPDCITKMGSKEGKNAWKLRKEAMDEVEAAVNRSNGLISTDPPMLKSVVDLLRALRERLSDSQSNLKPVAARIIGSILGSVDHISQAKLAKIVFAPLVSAVMNDNRKPMREASLEALHVGTSKSPLEGDGPNGLALESLMVAVVGQLSESDYKAGGLPDVLLFVNGVAEWLPNMDSITSTRAQNLGEKFASAMVECLTSSKSETRAAAETLLKSCIENEKLSLTSVKKGMKHLLPAQQRTVIPVIARLPHVAPASPTAEKENDVPSEPRIDRRVRKPASIPAAPAAQPRQRRRDRSKMEGKSLSSSSMQVEEIDSSVPRDSHPLIANGESGKNPRLPSRRINWPEHPEEPAGSAQLSALKKFWSTNLPQSSVAALFPHGGIRKQEDAKGGCDLLHRAIDKDRIGKEEAIVDHVDAIFMWSAYVLCSRESTVGLQALITLLLDLFAVLQEHQYKLSDAEAAILLPHVFEKASISKGRFREQFNEMISSFRSDSLLPTRSLGQAVCVPLIEHSQQAKTRLMAFHECSECVDKIGLSGIGKKGLLVTAKALSEETLPENRAAALDLMESVLSKMDGDVQKLASICGPTYLSDKGRALIEERWMKHPGSHQPSSHKAPKGDARTTRRSKIPSAKKATDVGRGSRRVDSNSSGVDNAVPSPTRVTAYKSSSPVLRDELPSLQLRLDDRGSVLSRETTESVATSAGPFAFSFEAARDSQSKFESVDRFASGEHDSIPLRATPDLVPAPSSSPVGAAAALRARLLKIRENQKAVDSATVASVSNIRSERPHASPDLSSPLTEPWDRTDKGAPVIESEGGQRSDSTSDPYRIILGCMEELLKTEVPVPEAEPRLNACTAALKNLHAAISDQPSAAPDMSHTAFVALRASISAHNFEIIKNLTSIFDFAFSCGCSENSAGMSISLLSVTLATLMALFRDPMLTQNVTQDELALLLCQAGKALLDPRLAVSSHHALATQLDESTSSQMVRAINKLAVQAATGSPRHVSIQALLALQLQLCTLGNETAADAAFNSRLSRIVTKLFAKVIKAEEATSQPFSSEDVDIESLLCSLEDMLVATTFEAGTSTSNRQDAFETCTSMGKSLMIPLLKSRGSRGVEEIREVMDELGIDPLDSKLAFLVTSCESEIDFTSITVGKSFSPSPAKPASMNVASLVSALGGAPEGSEREAAIASLRRYNEINGDGELNAHLKDVSVTFRDYIMEQLDESSTSDDVASRESGKNAQSLPMSERIRHLRSKLHATEAAVKSVVEPVEDPRSKHEKKMVEPGTPSRASPPKGSRLTPSRIPTLSSSSRADRVTSPTRPEGGTALSLRERLAAAQKNRAKAAESDSEELQSRSSSAYGHAAALRARLEAVKQQSKRDIN